MKQIIEARESINELKDNKTITEKQLKDLQHRIQLSEASSNKLLQSEDKLKTLIAEFCCHIVEKYRGIREFLLVK